MKFTRAVILLGLLAGCQGKSRVFENPVVGPPPPRVPLAHTVASGDGIEQAANDENDDDAEPGNFRLTSASSDPAAEPLPPTGYAGEVAARVNGTPIFMAELLGPYASKLHEVSGQLNPNELRRLQLQIAQRDLPNLIDRAVLVDAVMTQLDEDQKASVNEQLDKIFDQRVQEMMTQQGVGSVAELETLLQQSGTSLNTERKSFGEHELAMQYLGERIGGSGEVSRGDLLAEYKSHIDEYTEPGRVQWQQISIDIAKRGGREAALRDARKVQQELKQGRPFDALAREHSDGVMARQGGKWDWTQPESVADESLRTALSELEIGDTSELIETNRAFVLVQLTGRRSERTTPFEDVQDELRKQLIGARREARIREVVAKLKQDAIIETMFDDAKDQSESAIPAGSR